MTPKNHHTPILRNGSNFALDSFEIADKSIGQH